MHSHLHLSSFQHCLLLQTLASNLHLHLHVSCHSVCLVSLVLDIRFLITSGTHLFAYGSLLLLQLPLHLLVLELKGYNTGSSLLTLTICGYTLHSWLVMEIQLNIFTHVKVDNNANPVKKTFFYKLKHFVILYHSSSLNNCECLIYCQLQ